MTTIFSQVHEFKTTVAAAAPAEIAGVFTAEQANLAATTDHSGLVKAGDTVAPFTLLDATGKPVALAQLLAAGPAVLVFYRGAWCPYCNIMLAAYRAELFPALRERGVTAAAISPQAPDGSLSVQEKYDLEIPVLSDIGNGVARGLGIVWTPTREALDTQLAIGIDVAAANATDQPELPMPTVLVVDTDRTVRWADVRPDYTERAEVPDILAALDAGRRDQQK